MSNENVKVQLTGADIVRINDSLARVESSINQYQQVMFMGGPFPGVVLVEIKKFLEDKLKDAPTIGAPMPKPENQR